jgi:methionyl-tRNA formyltransferase
MINSQQNKRLILCGSHEVEIRAVEGLIKSGYKFSAVVCLTPEQAKKYNLFGYYDYRTVADKMKVPIYIPKTYSLTAEEDLDFFKEGQFDVLIQAGWQRLFPDQVLSTLNNGALGSHGSSDLLSKGRGRSPMNWSLIEGRKRFLMHLFILKSGVDDRDVITIRDFDITLYDDIETLYLKYGLVYRDLLIEYLPKVLNGTVEVQPQQGKPSYFPKRSQEDGCIDWGKNGYLADL